MTTFNTVPNQPTMTLSFVKRTVSAAALLVTMLAVLVIPNQTASAAGVPVGTKRVYQHTPFGPLTYTTTEVAQPYLCAGWSVNINKVPVRYRSVYNEVIAEFRNLGVGLNTTTSPMANLTIQSTKLPKGKLGFMHYGRTMSVLQIKDTLSIPDFRVVLRHEIGHNIGLDHSENPTDVMYYKKGPRVVNHFSASEKARIAAIQAGC